MTPRGVRNHNPGNIRHGDKWLGLTPDQPDPSFCTFTDAKYGIRALAILLRNYQKKHDLKTVRAIINRFAPPIENDTKAYIRSVVAVLGSASDDPIDVTETGIMLNLIKAIIRHENGTQPYSDETLLEGILL